MIKNLFCLILLLCFNVFSKDYYVSKIGNDNNIGSKKQPLLTIRKAISILKPGDICYIRKGTYLESVTLDISGNQDLPITIKAFKNETVVIKGLDKINTKFSFHNNFIYKTNIGKNRQLTQVFKNKTPLFEARYPNTSNNDIWNRNHWANAEKNSIEGKLFHENFKNLNINWDETHLVINAAHQFGTWSRPVNNFNAKENYIEYDFDFKLSTVNPKPWDDDQFYIFGSLGLLDSENEWYYNSNTGDLFIYAKNLKETKDIFIKTRDYGFKGINNSYLNIEGINFFGCTFNFKNAENLNISNCKILYPTYSRELTDSYSINKRKPIIETEITGNNNKLTNIYLAHTNTTGISIQGGNNLIDNCTIHDVNYSGSINYSGIRVWDFKNEDNGNNSIINNHIYNTGQIAIYFRGNNNLIDNNHISHAGLASKDIAAIHTVNNTCNGSIISNNIIHNSTEKAIRGDYQSKGLTIKNNIIWDCGYGIITKGDYHKVYNNLIIGEGENGQLLIPTRAEPEKWWAKTKLLKEQNKNSRFYDNKLGEIKFRKNKITDSTRVYNNTILNSSELEKLKSYYIKKYN